MGALPLLLLLGALFLCGRIEAQSSIDILKQAAKTWEGVLTCDKWDCDCTFNRQRSCCCAANDLYQIEEDIYPRMKTIWTNIMTLTGRVKALTDSSKVAFKATMNQNLATLMPGATDSCFGPFNTNVPIPYSNVALNIGDGYNPSLGIFTAPCPGVYQFSFTVYSAVKENERLYHKVQLMKNGVMGVSVWENNREDAEDSATQVVVLELQRGDQVYLELMSGRTICTKMDYNIFTGYILYPSTN